MILRLTWLPFGIAGICLWKGLILVKKGVRDSVIEHEKVHEKEWSLWWLVKYLASPVFRMEAEVRAYKKQAEIEHIPLSAYYEIIRDGYLLSAKAKALLPTYIKL